MNSLLTQGKSGVFTLSVSPAYFQIYRRMSSTLLYAVILLACALTFSAAQSEYNLCDKCFSMKYK